MTQAPLFPLISTGNSLATLVEREGNVLRMPEGMYTTPYTHGLHRFPGKFVPNLPRYFVREILTADTNTIVLDPFCGSGTTLVECALERKASCGVDIDPLAVMIARAKTVPLDESAISQIEACWKTFDYSKECHEMVPQIPNLSHWFTEQASAELSAIKQACLDLPDIVRNFCLVVFSSIIRRVSNADDQTQKTYVSHTLRKNPPLPSRLFPIFLRRALDGMRQYAAMLDPEFVPQVICNDARSSPNVQFTDVVTSPPYIDSIDYVYNQALEYFWLLPELGLGLYDNYRQLRKLPMGLQARQVDNLNDFTSRLSSKNRRIFNDAQQHIDEQSHKERMIIDSFFADFQAHCAWVAEAQARDRCYVCVIGNSVIRQVTVPTVDFFVDLFMSYGYRMRDRLTYEIRRHYMKFPRRSNSGKIHQDFVLILER